MDIELVPATVAESPALARLFQFHVYDFSEILDLEIRDDGVFEFGKSDGYWNESRYAPFLIRAGGHLAGFAIIDSQSRLSGERLWDVNQFFVLRRYRRSGVGSRAAVRLFDAFRGRWEVREAAANKAAQSFWRKVIAHYAQETGRRFEEIVWNDETWHGPVQRFDNGPASTPSLPEGR
jgi:predicted acetyltransferase